MTQPDASETIVALVVGQAPTLLIIGALYLAFISSYGVTLKAKWADLSATQRVGWICIPVLVGFLAVALLLTFKSGNFVEDYVWREMGRWVIDFILIFLPLIIFALFVVARSSSLLNSFIANLDRLGLLGYRVTGADTVTWVIDPSNMTGDDISIESKESRRRSITSYFERFQATYGDLAPDFVEHLIDATEAHEASTDKAVVSPRLFSSNFIPVYVVTVLCAVGWFSCLSPLSADDFPTTLDAYMPRITGVSAAFFGAYLFSMQLLVWRFMRRDLGPNAYVAFTLRLILAGLAAWILPVVLDVMPLGFKSDTDNENWILFLSFVIGVFPMVLWQLIAGAAKKFPGVSWALPSFEQALPLSDLDGLTVWHQARLEEEDVENVHNMATADIVDLMLSTRFPPHRIIDWIDQAILLSFVAGESSEVTAQRRNELRKYGIVNATGVLVTLREKHLGDDATIRLRPGSADPAQDSVKIVPWMFVLADNLQTNSNLVLVRNWKNIDPNPTH